MVALEREMRLATTVAAIQGRWGDRAITTARAVSRRAALSSGIEVLDQALGAGGFPLGHISELIGCGTAGHVTTAIRALEQAQRQHQQAVYVDIGAKVDVAALEQCSVRLNTLTILRPREPSHALAMTGDLLRAGYAGALVFDRLHFPELAHGEYLANLEQALRDWTPLLGRTTCTLLMLVETAVPGPYPDGLPLAYFADVRLLFRHERWLSRGRQITGYVTQVTLLKNRGGLTGAGPALSMLID